jgi:hypothetical protein
VSRYLVTYTEVREAFIELDDKAAASERLREAGKLMRDGRLDGMVTDEHIMSVDRAEP